MVTSSEGQSVVVTSGSASKGITARVYAIFFLVVVFLAIILKLYRVWVSSGDVDADSSVVGLMGLHISRGQALPIFFYGQPYMGSFEAIVAAIYFRVFGVSASSLFLVSTTFWGLFIFANFLLVRRVFGVAVATLASLFLALPPAYLDDRSFRMWGGYMETIFFGTLILFLSVKLSDLINAGRRADKIVSLIGFIVGFALWTHLAIVLYVSTSLVIFLMIVKKNLLVRRYFVFFLVYLLIGALPLILYNVFPDYLSKLLNFPLPSQGRWAHIGERFQTWDFVTNYAQPWRVRIIWGFENLVTIAKVSLPLLIGAQVNAGYYLIPTFSKLLLSFYSLVLIWVAVKFDPILRRILSLASPERSDVLRTYPLLLGLISVLAYSFGNFPFSFDEPRYIYSLYGVFPVLASLFLFWVKEKNVSLFLLLVVFILFNHLYPIYGLHPDIPIFSKKIGRETRIIIKLDELGIDRVYAGYHIGYPITFMTQERIIASPKFAYYSLNRYPRYVWEVDAAENPAFIFDGFGTETCCEADLLRIAGKYKTSYEVFRGDDFTIYYNLSRDIRNYLTPAKWD